MQIRDIEKLKVWLLKKLQPLCDADPAALSKYIIALLRKEKPRSALKELCINQLEVFLSKDTPTFVEKLFSSLESESYITGGNEDGVATPPLIVTASNRGNERSVGVVNSPGPERIVTDHRRQSEDTRHREVDDDDRDFRRSYTRHDSTLYSSSHPLTTTSTTSGVGGGVANDKNKIRKKIEVDPPRRSIRQRLGNREDDRRRRRLPRSRSRSRSSTPNRGSSHSPSTTPTNELDDRNRRKRIHGDIGEGKPATKRQRCKDYDERGMCLLGEQCPFDHGNDPLVITGIPPYPHHPPFHQLPLPPPPPPPPHPLPLPKATTGTDGYNPEDPALTPGTNPSLPPPPLLPQIPLRPAFPPPPIPPIPPPPPPGLHIPHTLHTNTTGIPPSAFVPVSAPPIAPPTSNYGSNTMVGGRQPSRPSNSIVLRKIPRDLNTITKLSGYFEKFGTIVNLQVRYENDPESATVQFSSPLEAKAAHDCTEAVLNNRFIKVYYLKNNSSGGGVVVGGANDKGHQSFQHNNERREVISKTAAPPITNKGPPRFQPVSTSGKPHMTTPTYTTQKTTPTNPPTYKLQKAPPTAPPTTNTVTTSMKRLELQKKSQVLMESQIKQQKLLLSKLEKGGKSLSSEERDKIMETIKTLSSSINKLRDSLSSVAKAATIKPHLPQKPYKGRPPSLPSPTTPPETLQQQAEQLRNEAQKLGLLSPTAPTAPPTNKKDTPTSASVLKKKAESKSTSLLVVNVEDKEALVKYFESFGGLNKIERDPENTKNVIFTFKNRTVAEKAAKGSLFQGRPLIMKWYTPKAPPTTDTPPLTIVSINKPDLAPPLTTPTYTNEIGKIKYPTPPTSLSLLDEEIEAELQEDLLISVYTPEHSKPRVVHLLDDEEEEELDERCWRH